MKKMTATLLCFCCSFVAFGQTREYDKMIALAKTYKNSMFRNEPSKEVLKEVRSDVPESLKVPAEFIAQAITSNNDLLTLPFLKRPDNESLKNIYIIRAINHNLRKEDAVDNTRLIDSFMVVDIPVYELVDAYYGMLFTAIGNKNKPFNLSKINFKPKEYELKDDTEKGIFFLKAMNACGSEIWGFMNIPKPANTEKAYDNIKNFPKFNGQPYYQYTDFYFTDFQMSIQENKGPQSYKSYYLDKYYEVLLSHLLCLNREGGTEKQKNDLLLGSILKEENLYKYTKHKETLESIFKVQKKD